jgi:hypothetical protein
MFQSFVAFVQAVRYSAVPQLEQYLGVPPKYHGKLGHYPQYSTLLFFGENADRLNRCL